jgi:hypothetical protein
LFTVCSYHAFATERKRLLISPEISTAGPQRSGLLSQALALAAQRHFAIAPARDSRNSQHVQIL